MTRQVPLGVSTSQLSKRLSNNLKKYYKMIVIEKVDFKVFLLRCTMAQVWARPPTNMICILFAAAKYFICCSQISYLLQPNISFAAAKYFISCSQIFNLLQPNILFPTIKYFIDAVKYLICCNQTFGQKLWKAVLQPIFRSEELVTALSNQR